MKTRLLWLVLIVMMGSCMNHSCPTYDGFKGRSASMASNKKSKSAKIPYSTEVGIEDFKDEENIIRVRATIFVERDSQKGIIIGKAGGSLKKVGTEARLDMEKFFGKKVFLETRVKVSADWRKQKDKLRSFGYLE